MTDATPAAPAADPTPAAPAAPIAAPAAQADSLLPTADKVEAGAAPAAPAAPPEVAHPEWFLSEGVKGSGAPPDYFKADKYKTMADQAKAYAELEKRVGAFTGAPKDGQYKVTVPEGLPIEIDQEHPLFNDLKGWALEQQLNQQGFDFLMGKLAEYEASQVPNMAEVKQAIGENADQRIQATAAWAKANLGPEGYELLREATSGAGADKVFRLVEAVVAKTRQPAMPKPGADVTGAGPTTEETLNAMQAKLGPDGRRLYETNPQWRAEVERRRTDYFASRMNGAAR